MAKAKTTTPDEQAPESVIEQAPEPFAIFRYLPNAKVETTFPSGVWTTLEFDSEGLFYCADNQWWSAACRAVVDADIPPGRIVQVSSKVVV